MDRRLMMLLIGLIFGGGIGFVTAAGYGVTFDGHDHATDHGGDHGGDHASAQDAGHSHATSAPIVLPQGDAAPTLAAMVHKDPASGWNLNVQTSNFRFSPENASTGHIAGEGHAHVYVNGQKIARLYADWYHIDRLPKGEVLIEVALNSNDHSEISVGSAPLRVGVTIIND